MASKKAMATIGAILIALAGGSWALTLDFSQTTIGQIGDNTINNIIKQELGIDLTEFKKLCDEGTVHEEFKQYCSLV